MKSQSFWVFLISFISVSLLSNCSVVSQGLSESYPLSTPSRYFKTTQRIVVEVYYEPGAEPFAGTTIGGMPYWNILEDNLNSIFQFRTSAPVVIVPKTLAGMHAIPAQGKTQWTGIDLVALNTIHREASPTETEARFYVYFLNGNFSSGGTAQTGVIGVSIGGTPVLGIFKSVIQNSGGPVVQRYVEQSTMVHELGHALGFVNNGVPMAVNHQDTAHGKHTSNTNCVMYWLNEGSTDMQQFVAHYISSGTTVMWGSQVLADAQAYSQ